jgi:hypothetical protein
VLDHASSAYSGCRLDVSDVMELHIFFRLSLWRCEGLSRSASRMHACVVDLELHDRASVMIMAIAATACLVVSKNIARTR